MKHFMFLLLLSVSICFADIYKIENHLSIYLDNDLYGHTKENFSQHNLFEVPPDIINRSLTRDEQIWLLLNYQKNSWSDNDNDWISSYRDSYTYDENYNQIQRVYEAWQGSMQDGYWLNQYRNVSTFNENNYQIEYLSQNWQDSIWVNYYNSTFTYDANNNRIEDFSYNWNASNNEWVINWRQSFTYDENNNTIEYLSQGWQDNSWFNSQRTTYVWDENNNQIEYLSQNWQDSIWVNNNKATYTYDANNNRIEQLGQDWQDSIWVNDYKMTLTYNSNNYEIERITQIWVDNNWVDTSKRILTYNSSNYEIERLYQNWDGVNWVNSSKRIYNRDEHNNTIEYFRINWVNNNWVYSDQTLYEWVSDVPVIDEIPDQNIDEDQTLTINLSTQAYFNLPIGFSAYSDTSSISLFIEDSSLSLSPIVDWNGSSVINVIATDQNGISGTIDFILTVIPVNDAPQEFALLHPTVSDTFSTHVDDDTLIPFVWEESYDVDSDVTYALTIELEFFGNTYTDVHENITDTTISVSSNSLDELLSGLNMDEREVNWYVQVSDEEYSVTSDTGKFVLSRASLSTIKDNNIPETFTLHQNYPNPFNPVTSLRYDLPEDGLVNITIYDMMGRIVKTLVNSSQTAGYKSIRWNATNDRNEPVSAGLYLYTIQAGQFRQTKKMVLLK